MEGEELGAAGTSDEVGGQNEAAAASEDVGGMNEAAAASEAPSEAGAPEGAGLSADPDTKEPLGKPVLSASTGAVKKRHEDKARRKDPRSWENLEKNISVLSPDEKLLSIKERYQGLYNDYRSVLNSSQAMSRQNNVLQRESVATHSELQKNMTARNRLESLCREMQKQNRQIKDEHLNKIKEEEERRREVSMRFTEKLNDITTLMDENKRKSEKLRDENLSMTSKLSELYTQFKRREEDIIQMSKQLELEREYSAATLAKLQLEITAQKETHKLEVDHYKQEFERSQSDCAALAATVESLQESIAVYRSQYSDFESTMSKSTEAFDNFKTEFATLSRQSGRLEKEVELWKMKYHDCMAALLEVTENKKLLEISYRKLEVKIDKLTKLCRKLQQDRAFFLCTLKANKIEPGVVPPFEMKSTPPKTKKEEQLQELRNNLRVMQEELIRLSIEDTNTASAVASESSPSTSRTGEEDILTLEPEIEQSDEGACALPECLGDEGACALPESDLNRGEPSTGT